MFGFGGDPLIKVILKRVSGRTYVYFSVCKNTFMGIKLG